jgi:hypothetical protein
VVLEPESARSDSPISPKTAALQARALAGEARQHTCKFSKDDTHKAACKDGWLDELFAVTQASLQRAPCTEDGCCLGEVFVGLATQANYGPSIARPTADGLLKGKTSLEKVKAKQSSEQELLEPSDFDDMAVLESTPSTEASSLHAPKPRQMEVFSAGRRGLGLGAYECAGLKTTATTKTSSAWRSLRREFREVSFRRSGAKTAEEVTPEEGSDLLGPGLPKHEVVDTCSTYSDSEVQVWKLRDVSEDGAEGGLSISVPGGVRRPPCAAPWHCRAAGAIARAILRQRRYIEV